MDAGSPWMQRCRRHDACNSFLVTLWKIGSGSWKSMTLRDDLVQRLHFMHEETHGTQAAGRGSQAIIRQGTGDIEVSDSRILDLELGDSFIGAKLRTVVPRNS